MNESDDTTTMQAVCAPKRSLCVIHVLVNSQPISYYCQVFQGKRRINENK